MVKKKILKGDSDFKNMVVNNGYFVDKTLFINEFYENGDLVLLMPRPRRFGKTLNLSMVEYFFDVRKKEWADIFSEFKINNEKKFCKNHLNQYAVINISLKSVRGENWESCLLNLNYNIGFLFQEHKYLLDSDKLEDYEKLHVEKLILGKGTSSDLAFSLLQLSGYLKTHFEKEVIILVDEYDTPIIDGYKEGYYKEIIKFMQVFMGAAFKGNPNLKKGLITGIMRIARESIFSEMNNVGVYTITNFDFADKFGFSEQEIKEILEYYELENHFSDVKKWYDGYKFGNVQQIYNPWSIVNYISRYREGFKPYWINTGTDSLIRKKILEPDLDRTYDTLQKLIAGETIVKRLDENFVFSDFNSQKELLWTLLTSSGYLTTDSHMEDDIYKLKIPNYEIKKVFKDIVIKWWEVDHKVARLQLENTAAHLVNNRLEEFEKGFKKIMGDSFSYFDIGGEPEKVYQSYVLGLLAILGDDYIIRSNRESGDGRYDILLMPHDKNRNGVIIEIKQIEKGKKESEKHFHKRINDSLKEAAAQIEDKQYYKELIDHKIKNIVQLPIIFAGKEPFVLPINGN